MSDYVMQIVDRHTGEVAVTWTPGSPAEMDFIDAVANRVGLKRVGVFTSVSTVQDKVIEAIKEEIHKLKSQVRPRL